MPTVLAALYTPQSATAPVRDRVRSIISVRMLMLACPVGSAMLLGITDCGTLTSKVRPSHPGQAASGRLRTRGEQGLGRRFWQSLSASTVCLIPSRLFFPHSKTTQIIHRFAYLRCRYCSGAAIDGRLRSGAVFRPIAVLIGRSSTSGAGGGLLSLKFLRDFFTSMPQTQQPSRFAVMLAFGLVYVFWASTYLAIDIAVQTIPPALMCALRFSIAGVVMLAVCAATGRRIRYSAKQIALSAVVGILLLMGGNPTLSWAELTVPSGLAALIIAITPLWFLVLDSLLLGHHRISGRGKAGLSGGIAGLFVLCWPELHSTSAMGRREFWASLALLGGSFLWALGSVLSKRWQSGMDVFSATAWQVTAAGAANFLFAFAAGDFSRATWTTRGVSAVLYLVVCGSWIGYTAYIWLLEHVPTSKVSTYAYVNPVVAVFLGWLVLHERVDRFIVMGSVIVVLSVILVTSAKVEEKGAAEELPVVVEVSR